MWSLERLDIGNTLTPQMERYNNGFIFFDAVTGSLGLKSKVSLYPLNKAGLHCDSESFLPLPIKLKTLEVNSSDFNFRNFLSTLREGAPFTSCFQLQHFFIFKRLNPTVSLDSSTQHVGINHYLFRSHLKLR